MADKKITELTDYTPPIDTDVVPLVDVTTGITKKITWANVKAFLKTYFDTLYGASQNTTATAGENITDKNAVFIGDGTTEADILIFNTDGAFQSSIFGGSGTNEAQGQKFTGVAGSITKVKIYLAKINNPTDNTVVGIQADSDGSPDGSYIASGTISNSTLTTSNAEYTITLDSAVVMTPGTTYHLVITRSGARDTTNRPLVVYKDADTYAGGNRESKASGTWTQNTGDELRATLIGKFSAGLVYKASALSAATSATFVGFASGNATSGNPVTINTGLLTTTGLTAGKKYYLSNTYGAIATSAGTVERKVGIAISATVLKQTNIW